jgi:hypothetical protein
MTGAVREMTTRVMEVLTDWDNPHLRRRRAV